MTDEILRIKRLCHKPEYIFNPTQVVKRLQLKKDSLAKSKRIELPWSKQDFIVNPNEVIGKSLLSFGLYDLAITEVIYRLVSKGSFTLDIGANIGYFSRLMAERGATVHSFEPHPSLMERLNLNIDKFPNVNTYELALSESIGTADFYIPNEFGANEGTASLVPNTEAKKMTVQTSTIDEIFPNQVIDLVKIDVEGAELSVFNGANAALNEGRIKNIVFEDFEGPNSQVIQRLREKSYSVHRILKGFWGPKLVTVEEGMKEPLWEPPNYLATLEPNVHFSGPWRSFGIFKGQ